MRERMTVDAVWRGIDRLLLLTVAILLMVCWAQSRVDVWPPAVDTAGVAPAVKRPGAAGLARPNAIRVAESTPVSLSANRISLIARAMAESAWEGVPDSPVEDMREQNGFYDILFSLPGNMDPESVKTSTSGNVLTLYVRAVGTPAATFVKQFFIPCGAARVGAVETSVSNDFVRVRIHQPNG